MATALGDSASARIFILQARNVKEQNAIGVEKLYHALLKHVVNAIRLQDALIPAGLSLRLPVKEINDTAGPHGLVTSLVVFGRLP